MRASALVFRLRYPLHFVILALGFWAPWIALLSPGSALASRQSTWLTLTNLAARNTVLSFSSATICLLVAGIILSSGAALLRTWASAYLGASIVKDQTMHGTEVTAGGPYRFLRNPLYAGVFLHTIALSLLMPPTGSIFAVVLILVLEVTLIAGEEAFLTQSLGSEYIAYREAVPSVFPTLRPTIPAASNSPRWLQALLGESYVIGVALAFAVAGWHYNAMLLIRCVVVSLGVSIVARAFIPVAPSIDVRK